MPWPRHSTVVKKYQAQGLEFAVHGLVHVEHTQLSLDDQRAHLNRARRIFEKAGLRIAGFRCPYLRWNADTLAALSECGFDYDSSQVLAWEVVDGFETAAYRRVLAFYGAQAAVDYPALPRLTGDGRCGPFCEGTRIMHVNEYFKRNLRKNFSWISPYYKNEILPYILLSLAFFVLVFPLVLRPEIDVYDARDEAWFHYPTTLTFINQFPNLDLINYRSATTPLYHIILTLSAFMFGSGIIQLRFINSVISLACLLVVYGHLSKRGGRLKGLLFAVIFMLSPYFIGPAIRLSTDNAALLFAFLSILTMDTNISSTKHSPLTNILILFTILTRQIYAWLIGAYLLLNLQRRDDKRLVNLLKTVLPIFIPVTGLAFFLFLWKGLAPPYFARHSERTLNWDVPVYIVSLVGLYGSFFCLWYLRLYRQNRGKAIYIITLVVLSIGYLLLHPVSNEYYGTEYHETRGGALWLVAMYLPTLFSSSIVYWVLFPIGLLYLYVITQHLALKQDYLMIICFSLWLIANMASTRTYQKYYEPFLLFLLGYSTVILNTERWYYWGGPIILLVGFVGIALLRFL